MHKNQFIDKIKLEWQELGKKIISELAPFPSTLMLELTNACNLSCVICRNSTMKRKRGFMPIEMVEKALVEAKLLNIRRVALYTTGESLLHPDFISIAKLCTSSGFTTYLTTNALLLNDKMCNEIISTNLESIKISIDGTTKEEYEKIRKRGKFEKLISNLKMLFEIRNKNNSPMKIYAGAVISKFNDENISSFKEVYRKYVDGIYLSPLVNQSGQLAEMYERLKSDKIQISTNWKPCKMLWDRVVISWEGKLVACCVDYENDLEYGDFNTSKLTDLWNSEKMEEWRRMHLSGNVNEMQLCKTCNAPYIQQVEILEQANVVGQ
jgi:radical SAM protein with 4Fe4S-binding SPASM domain